MNTLVLACLVAMAAARPQELLDATPPLPAATLQDAGILRMQSTQGDDGSFQYSFETAGHIVQEVSGRLKQFGDTAGIVMQGRYSFVATDENGRQVPVEVRWTADENGFRPEGDVIPVAPEAAAADVVDVDVGAAPALALALDR